MLSPSWRGRLKADKADSLNVTSRAPSRSSSLDAKCRYSVPLAKLARLAILSIVARVMPTSMNSAIAAVTISLRVNSVFCGLGPRVRRRVTGAESGEERVITESKDTPRKAEV